MSRFFSPELLSSKMKGIRPQGSARGEGDKFDSTDKAEDLPMLSPPYPYIPYMDRCRDMLGGSRRVA